MSDLSEAARTLRNSDNPQEKSEAASKLGKAGGHSRGELPDFDQFVAFLSFSFFWTSVPASSAKGGGF
jgi:hypothetical protein